MKLQVAHTIPLGKSLAPPKFKKKMISSQVKFLSFVVQLKFITSLWASTPKALVSMSLFASEDPWVTKPGSLDRILRLRTHGLMIRWPEKTSDRKFLPLSQINIRGETMRGIEREKTTYIHQEWAG